MKRAITRTKRAVAVLLVIVAGCYRGPVYVSLKDVAAHADDVRTKPEVEVDAIEYVDEGDSRRTTASIRKDQRVDVGFSFSELLDKCPTGSFSIDLDTKKAFPDCKLASLTNESVKVDSRLFVDRNILKVLTGVAGASLGIGIVYCAKECGSPYQEIAIGTAIVGGVIALLAIVFVAGIDTN
jgi:hypothetical protein